METMQAAAVSCFPAFLIKPLRVQSVFHPWLKLLHPLREQFHQPGQHFIPVLAAEGQRQLRGE